ncbi:squamosa promoter-binding-like protein 6 [Canna indica]|uniref:Squamosa promoter-binding-like protein 6 n=1 Tax=Canna indica TaxID=4628 RepID=A0AAQ3L2K9_9LILI|nr:squamosa promoter-binding-like protein 6 [Canna indica]
MEARFGSESHQLFAAGSSNVNGIGKRNFEWDLNDWRWDGELFVASPLNAVSAVCRDKQLCLTAANGLVSNSSSSSSECADFGLNEKGKGEAEKRMRIIVVDEDEPCGGAGSLSLKLGGHAYPIVEADLANLEGNNGKKSKSQGGHSNRPTCQVEGCATDLSDSKDYHRRHKVCETHAKASSAIVKNAIQRFCQQCSRFHLLEEFDEGKRSCRRRLAGHNRRRRKTHPDANVNGNTSVDERACGSLLISLLRILSNSHSANSNGPQDEELIAHFLVNLASVANSFDPSSLSRLLQASQDPQKLGTTARTSSEAVINSVPNGVHEQESGSPLCSTAVTTCVTGTQNSLRQTDFVTSVALTAVASPEYTMDRVVKDFDLNNTYSDSQDCEEGREKPAMPIGIDSPNFPSWLLQDSLQSSPPQTSGNSDSTSNQSQSSLHATAQYRTDRIIFKLFGKDPNDLPLVLRAQIVEWLSNTPSDVESYIRPGCIILTIYLCQAESAWVELCYDLYSNLSRLLHNSTNEFWSSGWIFARLRDHAAFICDGQIVLDMPLRIGDSNRCKILSVTPIAVSHSKKAKFMVKGFNLAQSTSRLLCSFDGKYLAQETTGALAEETDRGSEHELSHCLSFSCLLPSVTGRGFIEFEDSGLHNEFFPFIVAEEDVCSEIRKLESAIDIDSHQIQKRTEVVIARNEALDFINELGWLLRRNHMRSISGETKFSPGIFPLARFRWLMSFAMSKEWSAVVKNLLDVLFNGTVDASRQSPTELVLSENLLHRAVQIKSRPMVELLLRYVPNKSLNEADPDRFLFRPDMLGPLGISPLHIAASSDGAESILDALTDDPGLLGIKAWKNLRDSTGFTPEGYALARGHNSYITLVQKKIDKQNHPSELVLNISGDASHKQADASKTCKPNSLELSKSWLRTDQQPYCGRCSQQLVYPNSVAKTMLYRPLMLSLVGIAAVCVCVGLLFKTPPQVFYVSPSFRWELLDSGSM